MKKRIFSLLLALLLSNSFLVSCAKKTEETEGLEDPFAEYETRIAELEGELQKQREEKYISDSAYEKEIAALEAQLKALDGTQETLAPSDENEFVFHYRVENGKATITGFEGAATLVTVPETLNGYPVVAIGEHAFSEKPIAAIILPDGLESIGWFAFYGCRSLVDVTLPDSVTSIGYAVFDGCPNVTLVCSPNSYAAQYAASYGLPRVSGS